jgi:endonuclease/exonuclease/phosphatase family metal-dependent hydrolase
MRLLSYNVHGCIGRRGIVDPDAIIAVIREADADVVALQEVHNDTAIDRSFLRSLEHELGYPAILHGPTMRKADADYGNVLMSRIIPIADERIDLSFPHREPRGAIRANLEWEGRSIEITATHLGLLPTERRDQLRRLADHAKGDVEAGRTIQVLMGDLNEWFPFGRAGRTLRRRFGRVKTVPTFPARFPLFALDRIHVRPDHLVRVNKRTLKGKTARTASDHLPLVAELTLL